LEWKPADPHQPGVCPRCGKYDFDILRCTEKYNPDGDCHLSKLEDAADNSSEASILSEIRDIENQVNLKFNVDISQVRADVWPVLILLSEERERWRKEHPQG
jgi:hypothetical protein